MKRKGNKRRNPESGTIEGVPWEINKEVMGGVPKRWSGN